MKKKLLAIATLLCGALLAGCASGGSEEQVGRQTLDAFQALASELHRNAVPICASTRGTMLDSLRNFLQRQYEVTATEEDVAAACLKMASLDPDFALEVKEARDYIAKQGAGPESSQDYVDPEIVSMFNEKAMADGNGTLEDLYRAINSLETRIKNEAAYALTGIEVEVESVYCRPTSLSSWFSGAASGWWFCGIHLLGNQHLTYSIEVSDENWAGSSDGGASAGKRLAWFDTVPYEVKSAVSA